MQWCTLNEWWIDSTITTAKEHEHFILFLRLSRVSFFSTFSWEVFILQLSKFIILIVKGQSKHFYIHFWWIRSIHFSSKDKRDASYEERNGWKDVRLPAESAFQPLMLFLAKVIFTICTLAWRENNVSRQQKCVNSRYEKNWKYQNTIVIDNTEIIISHFFVFPYNNYFNC